MKIKISGSAASEFIIAKTNYPKILRSFRLHENLVKRLDQYSEKSFITRTQLVELALIEFFKNHPLEK